jgi:hypothetical protein
MSITSHPASLFPAISSHGNPSVVPSIRSHMRAGAFARARAIRSSAAGVPARSRARRTVGLGYIRDWRCRSRASGCAVATSFGYRLEVVMADMLIRDVPDDVGHGPGGACPEVWKVAE